MRDSNDTVYTERSAIVKKPLYLLSKEASLVTHRTGSLLFQRPEEALRRFPLVRIDRIITNQHVRWSGNAIMAALIQKIPITWVTANMQTVGHASPRQLFDSGLNEVCAIMVESPNWQETYQNVLKSLRQHTLNWIFSSLEREDSFYESRFRALQRSFVHRNEYEEHLSAQLRASCDSYIVSQLCKAELMLSYVGLGGEVLALANDLSELLWATINIDVQIKFREEGYAQVYFFENWIKANPLLVARWLKHIHLKLSQNRYVWL